MPDATIGAGRALTQFVPSGARGRVLDVRMHRELANSFEHLAEASARAMPEISQRLNAVAQALHGGCRVRPQAFRAYYLLVQALVAEDQVETDRLLSVIETTEDRAAELRLTYFGKPDADNLCLDLIEDGFRMAPISELQAEEFALLLEQGVALAKEGIPEMHDELRAIVHEVLLARAPMGDKMEFDGASHYQFWGLLMLNPKHHRTPLAVVEVLAHEASHSLLFGMTIEEPLVLNPDDELYKSPLRQDPRPMDGIYHATYVSARMAWAMEAMAASGCLGAEEKAKALEMAATDRRNYEQGLSVIDEHGRLSDTGKTILDAGREWIAA